MNTYTLGVHILINTRFPFVLRQRVCTQGDWPRILTCYRLNFLNDRFWLVAIFRGILLNVGQNCRYTRKRVRSSWIIFVLYGTSARLTTIPVFAGELASYKPSLSPPSTSGHAKPPNTCGEMLVVTHPSTGDRRNGLTTANWPVIHSVAPCPESEISHIVNTREPVLELKPRLEWRIILLRIIYVLRITMNITER